MPVKEQWVVKFVRRAASALYIVALLMGVGVVMIVGVIDALNPHIDGITALYMMIKGSSHELVFLILLLSAGSLAATDMLFRYQGRYAKY